jgi:hypothetical protein
MLHWSPNLVMVSSEKIDGRNANMFLKHILIPEILNSFRMALKFS